MSVPSELVADWYRIRWLSHGVGPPDVDMLRPEYIVDREVLDLGCFFPDKEIVYAARARRWVAIDFLPEVIEQCIRYKAWPSTVEFLVMDFRKLEFGDSTFDTVCDFSSGDHVTESDWLKVLRECHRILRRDGVLIISYTNLDYCLDPTTREVVGGEFGYERRCTAPEMRKYLENSGFSVEWESLGKRSGVIARKTSLKFVVIIPTYNRTHALVQTLDSVLVQTYKNWVCYVLDDGSTDGTPPLVEGYTKRDSRIRYIRYEENRGGVAMNEIGMDLACEHGDVWVRLGSDDWFEPMKLELDAIALTEGYGACFGPYRNYPEVWEGELNGPSNPRPTLLQGIFAVSWANIAVRTGVLRSIKQIFGSYCDSRLRNMEDNLFNSRLAKFTNIVWRGLSRDGKMVSVGAKTPEEVPFEYVPDAHYRVALDGASNSPALRAWLEKDHPLSEKIIGEDRARKIPAMELPEPEDTVVFLDRRSAV